jgi:hypothetical protein
VASAIRQKAGCDCSQMRRGIYSVRIGSSGVAIQEFLICATIVCTVCEPAQPRLVKNSSHITSAPAHEDLPRRRTARWLSAYFLEPNWRSRCQSGIKPPSCFMPIPGHTVAIFRQINKGMLHTNHDALEFPDGEIVLLTRLCEGQKATVLTLPPQAKTAAEVEAQQRVAYAG